jgi:hypothetical protein
VAGAAPRTVTLPLRAWLAVVVVVLVGLGVFVAQLVLIAEQRHLIDHQDRVATRQARRARPVLQTADALLGSPAHAVGALHRAGTALRALQGLLHAMSREDLVGVAASSLSRVPELVALVDRSVAVLDRTYPTLRASLALQRRSLDVQQRTLALLQRSEGIQRRTEGLAAGTLAVARATLGHTESIDRKTGGQVPAALP